MSDEDLAVQQQDALGEEVEELSDEEQAMAKLKEAISVEKKEIGSLRLKMTVTIPAEIMDERRSEQFAELKRDASVPGFRKGHAPMALIEKRFASDVGEQLKTQLFSSGYLAAVEKEDLKPLGDPLFWTTVEEERIGDDKVSRKFATEKLLPIDQALESLKLPKEGSLTFSCELELKPEFELPKLDGIPVTRPALGVDDADVDGEIKRMCMMRGTFQPVEKGKIELDDMVYADMKMSVDGEVIASEENIDLAARDIRLKGVALKGLGDALTGKKTGDAVAFEATVPDDHERIDLRGKTAKFEFSLHEIKRLVIPPVDAEFLGSIGMDSEEELRDTVRGFLEQRLDSAVRESMQEQVGLYLIENTDLEIPEGLSQKQTERSVARRMIELYQAGLPESEIEKQLDEMRAQAQDQVIRDLKLFFILDKVADDREVDVTEEQLNGAIAQMARRSNKRFDRVRDELSKGDGLAVLYHQLRDQQVLESLLAQAVITESEGPKKKASPPKTAKKKTVKKAGQKAPGSAAEKKTSESTAKKAAKKTAKKSAKKTGKRS